MGAGGGRRHGGPRGTRVKPRIPRESQQFLRDVAAVGSQLLQHRLVQPHVHLRRFGHLVGRAAEFGESDRLVTGALQALVLGGLLLVGRMADLGLYFHLALLVALGLAVYQQYLIRQRDRDGCFQAFLNNNWFGAVVFAGIFLHYLAA